MPHYRNMKRTPLLITMAVGMVLMQSVPDTKADTASINFSLGQFTSGGNSITSGSLFLISWGTNNIFDSTLPIGSSSIVGAGDILFYGASFTDGGVPSDGVTITYSSGGLAVGQTFSALFVNGLTSAQIDYTTGAFKNGLTIQSSGLQYAYGTYSTNAASYSADVGYSSIPWSLPAAGSTVDLYAYNGSGVYPTATPTANLATSSSFYLSAVPEPSQRALIVTGIVGLGCVVLRRRLASRV
jgi:hypothetical protein